ncbi:4-hydroxy-tetrahydrodipicolinate reductase [Lactobacillus sp. ESL0684]|uniref:4-hydroxy-tetrahydrodipicolinate reductase n=1 Tax=Lactobacillus sp. ESL0684 TaxID=2983213 RepID=UPI0023F93BB5|nr:4-hydroxy-tetrahydrodipicolinate reductase [Lactobacillus sp. ESL0684]WEV43871.1 4-hydroxy-tetrahydrodipicolinate reductase [Lactobacillus sp. ESL0684]
MLKVFLAGFNGSMGQEVVKLIDSLPDYEITGVLAPHLTSLDPATYQLASSVKMFKKLTDITGQYDIWIDFTVPSAVYDNTKFAIEHNIKPIIGTSGLTDDQTIKLQVLATDKKVGGIIAPNFGLSAILLMKFAQIAAAYFPDAEIIEMHHTDKKDAPSGTAIQTAQIIAQNRNHQPEANFANNPARGADKYGIPIHAVRLPGYVAHEQVLFGGDGEALTIRQDSFDRHSFMHGVRLALEKVSDLHNLVIGLENLI